MSQRLLRLALLALILFLIPGSALAQTYSFSLDQDVVNLFWNADGTLSIDYVFAFTNTTWADAIDFIDIGLPNSEFERGTIYADVNGNPITDIEDSPYVEYGVALGLGAHAIQPGASGIVHAYIGTVHQVLYQDSSDDAYASAVFIPTWFSKEFLQGQTDLTVIFHLPPGVQPEEPRWHEAPAGFPSEPVTGLDAEGRITYTWRNSNANGYNQYRFGASFPESYVPEEAITRPNPFQPAINFVEGIFVALPGLVCAGFFGLIVLSLTLGSRKRKLQYLPPKVAIEGHGIKRGLTAIEAAILMEQPMDKILTMMLFSVIKKGAARVTRHDPLELETIKPLPDGLYDYEKDFLNAFETKTEITRRKALQSGMISLVKQVAQKMKGFSRNETIQYYRGIVDKAWQQVEAAETPEIRSEKYDEVMEWTMLDRNYDDRLGRVFRQQPVIIPSWWGSYDPTYSGGGSGGLSKPSIATSGTAGKSGGSGLPHLPGSDFAASIVNGTQDFSARIVGNLASFTAGITRTTNPAPKPTYTSGGGSFRSGGGGSSCACACACACAGCACACAGGGR